MHQLFDPDSWIMGVLSEIADLMIVNVLWILTSIPIFTIGASTTALYAVVKTPGSKRYASSVVKNYFSAFRRNFRSATLTFLILLVPMALVLCNIFLLLFGLLEGGRGIASTLISFAALAVCAKLGEGKLGMQGTITFYAVVLMVLGDFNRGSKERSSI